MGVLSGAVRLRRYQALSGVPDGFQNEFSDAIEKSAFRDFEANDEREQVVGWVGVDDWFNPSLHLDRWLVEDLICLTLRVDTKRIPARFFRHECRKMEAEWRTQSGREELSRAEREEVQGIVKRRLLERAIPSCQGIDCCWDLKRDEVWFWSTGEKVNELFCTLFERTFRIKLRPLFPYTMALRVVGEEAKEMMERAVPAIFHKEGGA